MQSKAQAIVRQMGSAQHDMQRRFSPDTQRQLQLAADMLERCITYYDTLGSHWLGTPRKLECKASLASARLCMDTFPKQTKDWPEIIAKYEPVYAEVKRMAQRELGPQHCCTINRTW